MGPLSVRSRPSVVTSFRIAVLSAASYVALASGLFEPVESFKRWLAFRPGRLVQSDRSGEHVLHVERCNLHRAPPVLAMIKTISDRPGGSS